MTDVSASFDGEIDDNALADAHEAVMEAYNQDMKILMNYGDGRGYQETDEDDCIRHLVTVAVEAYLKNVAK